MNAKHIGRIVITFMLALGMVMLFVVANSKKAVAIVTALYHLAIMSLYGLVP